LQEEEANALQAKEQAVREAKRAEKAARKAASEAQKAEREAQKARDLAMLGDWYQTALGAPNYKEKIKTLSAIAQYYQDKADARREAETLVTLADLYIEFDDDRIAVRHLTRAVKYLEPTNYRRQAEAYQKLSQAYENLKQPKQAVAASRRSADFYAQAGEKRMQAAMLLKAAERASAPSTSEEFRATYGPLTHAVRQLSLGNDRDMFAHERVIVDTIARVRSVGAELRDERDTALVELYSIAAQYYRTRKLTAEEARQLQAAGRTLLQAKRYEQAEQQYEAALNTLRNAGYRLQEAYMTVEIAADHLGEDSRRAESYFARAVTLPNLMPWEKGGVLYRVGNAYSRTSDAAAARKYYEAAIDVLEVAVPRMRDKTSERERATVLVDLMYAHKAIGNPAGALKAGQHALEIYRTMKSPLLSSVQTEVERLTHQVKRP
jgi:hypothetical protein